MTEHVPAWKRAGLQQQAAKHSYDPLAAGLKRAETGGSGPKKTPKRVKLAKKDRKPPPEADQLAYLRQYSEDHEHWKFSKQKQNWILKHMLEIDEKYEKALITYVESVQGASRQRVVNRCETVVGEWNSFMAENPSKDSDDDGVGETGKTGKDRSSDDEASNSDKDRDNEQTEETSEQKIQDAQPGKKPKNKKPEPPKPQPPKEATAKRAQTILEVLTGNRPSLMYID